MDFNAIYKLNEAEDEAKVQSTNNPAPAQSEEDGLPQDVHASEEALNIAMNQLQLIVKSFKEDNYIQQMMYFYDGKSAKKESVEADNNAEHLTEARKGSFKSYYNQIVKSLSNTQKKIKIAAMILIATAIVAGVGFGTVLIKKLVNGKKALKASNALANSITPATIGAVKQNVVPPTNTTVAGQDAAQPAVQNVQPEVVQQKLKPADQQIVSGVIKGEYGNAPERTENLIKAGYDPVSVQNAVNASEAAKTVPNAIEPTPAPAEVEQTVEKALNSGEIEVSNTGEVKVETPQTTQAQQPTETATTPAPQATQTTQATVDTANPSVAPSTQDASSTPINNPVQNVAPQPTITSNDAAYESWKANPNNQKMLNNLTLQARAAGQDPEAVMKDVFNNGGSVDALRTIEAKYGLSDISGNGVTDRGMLRSINTANLNSWKNQQYQQLQSDPDVQAYLNFVSNDRQLAGKSLTDIGSKATGFNSYTGLYEWSTDNNNHSVWTQKPGVTAQIKNGLSKIQKIARTNKLPN
jgi:hypothetical protein